MDKEIAKELAHEWKPSSLGDVLVDADGKIIGEVYKAIGTGHHAIANKSPLGIYYTETQARRAVVSAILNQGSKE